METNVGSPVSQAADVPSPARLSQLITGFRITQAIYVAATLGIADLLAIAPRPVEEVARVTGKGRERTAAEVEVLLDQAGFAQTRVIPTAGLPSIVESRPA
jgi:hypothetical protein